MNNSTPNSNTSASPTGASTMSSGLPYAQNYHRYLFETLKPYCGKRVWEIGSGYGQYTRMFLEEEYSVLASDIDRDGLSELESLKNEFDSVDARYVDLNDSSTIYDCASWKPDTIFCLNVLEHIDKHMAALSAIHQAVPDASRAVFLTPAFQMLFGFMDSDAGHFRRFTRKTLSSSFESAGWKVEKSFYLNPIGGVGWFVRNRILPSKGLHLDSDEVNRDLAFFDKYCVKPTEFLEVVTQKVFGQSVVVVATK